MDARAARRGVPAVFLWVGFGALAWAALTILTGGGVAHADEQSDGPLDGLTTVVSETVSAVTAPVVNHVVTPAVTQVVAPVVKQVAAPVVTQVAAPVVNQAVAPVVTHAVAPAQQAAPEVVKTATDTVEQIPVVGTVAAPVLDTASDVAAAVVDPVTDLLSHAPVSRLTRPVLDAVSGLPLLGGIVVDAGLVDLVDSVVGVVDDTTGLVGGVVDQTVPPALEALTPETRLPSESIGGKSPAVVVGASVVLGGATSSSPASFDRSSAHGAHLGSVASGTSDPGEHAPVPPSGPPPGPPAAPTSSAGSGGGSTAAHARISDVGAAPLSVWQRNSGASDDTLPGAPVADTDVSPD